LKVTEISVPRIRIDKSAISLVKNSVHHDKSKHTDVRIHLIREYENSGQIILEFIRTEDQLADILTKQVGKEEFSEMCSKIGLRKNPGKCNNT
jgi:hypothetical protein